MAGDQEKMSGQEFLSERGRERFAGEIAAGLGEHQEVLNQEFAKKDLDQAYEDYGHDFDSFIAALKALAVSSKHLPGLTDSLQELAKKPQQLLKPKQLQEFSQLLDYSFDNLNKPRHKTEYVLKLTETGVILNQLSLKQRAQLLESYLQEHANTDQKRGLSVARMFIQSNLLAKQTVIDLAEQHGYQQQSLAAAQKEMDEFSKQLPKQIKTTPLYAKDRSLLGIAGSYYAFLTAAVNLALYVGDTIKNGKPGDNRYLALALGAGVAGAGAAEVATSDSHKEKGLVWQWLEGLTKGKERSQEAKKQLERRTNQIVFADSASQKFFTDQRVIDALKLPELNPAKNDEQAQKSSKQFAEAMRKPNNRELISRLRDRLKGEPDLVTDLDQFAKQDSHFNYKLLEVATAYQAYKVDEPADVQEHFGYESIYA